MKNAILAAAALGMSGISAFAQGTLNFANAGVGLQAKVTDTDQVTGLAGTAWEADLFWAPGVVTDPWLLTALGQPATFSTVPSQAGFFFGGPRTIPTAPGVITAQVRIWDAGSGPSWAVAITNPGAQLGESVLFQVTLADPNAAPPGIPATMTGLNGHPFGIVLIPEPSPLALAALMGMLFRGRRR